jgi:hypothetical protein
VCVRHAIWWNPGRPPGQRPLAHPPHLYLIPGPRRPRLRQPGQGALSELAERIAATTAIHGAGELLHGPVLMIGGALEQMRTMPSLRRYCAKCDRVWTAAAP